MNNNFNVSEFIRNLDLNCSKVQKKYALFFKIQSIFWIFEQISGSRTFFWNFKQKDQKHKKKKNRKGISWSTTVLFL